MSTFSEKLTLAFVSATALDPVLISSYITEKTTLYVSFVFFVFFQLTKRGRNNSLRLTQTPIEIYLDTDLFVNHHLASVPRVEHEQMLELLHQILRKETTVSR